MAIRSVISFTSDKMGKGDDELGGILIQAFINTLMKQDPLPATLIFYNTAVKLCTTDSPVLDALQALEQQDVQIILCGTCVNYFNLRDHLGVGTVSNMYTIQETLNHADRIITP